MQQAATRDEAPSRSIGDSHGAGRPGGDAAGRPAHPAAARAGRGPLLRLFSSVTFGIVLLTLILVYASFFSALSPVRGAIEVTEMEIFRHWVFVVLVVLFCVTLAVATWTRIRWNVTNLGVLTVHTGLLLLVGGSVWYFGTKIEGDILVQMPRVEVVSLLDPGRGQLGAILAEKDKAWAQNLPAFGGALALLVDDVQGDGPDPVTSVRVRFRSGGQPVQTIELTRERPMQAVSESLALRLRTFPPAVLFYDDEKPALVWQKVGAPEQGIAPLTGLPMYRERYLDDGYELRQRDGLPAPSKRNWPHVNLLGVALPTGWFEHWRLPIAVDAPQLPFDIQVTGYVPYALAWRSLASAATGAGDGPALNFSIIGADRPIQDALFAEMPARSLSSRAPVEFRWARDTIERDALLTPMAGRHELTIQLLDPPLTRILSVERGQRIELEGTPYVLEVDDFQPMWQLVSPGLRGGVSPAATVTVRKGETRFQRTVIQRFPAASQDVDDAGMRHSEGPVDSNIVLRYRSAGDGWLMVVAGPDVAPMLGVWREDGSIETFPLTPGAPAPLGGGFAFVLEDLFERGRLVDQPLVEPLVNRQPGAKREVSAIRLHFRGRDRFEGWSQSVWVPYSRYADVHLPPALPRRPITIQPPGSDERWEFLYTRTPLVLGAGLAGVKLQVDFFPGGLSPERWFSDFYVVPMAQVRGAEDLRLDAANQADPSEPEIRRAHVFTNRTAGVGRWTLFQSGADFDEHWQYTILGVGNREGMWPMIIGSILIPLGCLYAFYVKPVLIRRRKNAALAARPGSAAAMPGAE